MHPEVVTQSHPIVPILTTNERQLRVFAIVVTYNGMKWLDRCLSSLLQDKRVETVIVVDNGSKDGTCEAARALGGSVWVQESQCNLGFGKANNLAIEQAIVAGASHVFLLNQDAWIEPNGVEKLLEAFDSSRRWGIVCPIQVTGDGKRLDRLSFSCLPEELVSDYCLGNAIGMVYPVPFMNAAAWLISCDTIKAVGVFDPLFSMYGEDDDYVRRLHSAGLQIGLCPGIRVFHDRAYRALTPAQARNRSEAWAILYLKYADRALVISTTLIVMRSLRGALSNALRFRWFEASLHCRVAGRVLRKLSGIRRSKRDLNSLTGNLRGRSAEQDESVEVLVTKS